MGNDIIGLAQEARQKCVGVRRAQRLVRRGLVEARLIGRTLVIQRGALDRWARLTEAKQPPK